MRSLIKNLDKLKEMFNRIRDMQLLIITVENEFMNVEGMKIVVSKGGVTQVK